MLANIRPVLAIAFLGLPLYCNADSIISNDAAKLSPYVDSVIECGAWKYGDKEGVYRIIYGLEAGHTELYVQWVTGKPEPSAADSEPAIVATAPITELDYYHSETMLENITCGTRSGTWIIEADADDGYKSDTDKDSKYRVVVILKDQPGKYWFRKEHSKPKTD